MKVGIDCIGSGSKSKVFEAKVTSDWQNQIAKTTLFETLESCTAIDFATYEKLHKKELKQSVIGLKNEFYLDSIEKENSVLVGARYYKFENRQFYLYSCHTTKTLQLQNSPLKIEASEADYLYIETSQLPNAGKGLFSAIKIYKDEIISIFKGEILTEIEAKNRAHKNLDKYFINMIDGTIMDSMHVDCFAKYANDAEAFGKLQFQNNAEIKLDDENNVCIIATKSIKPYQEIFCSYGRKYWKKHG